MWHVDTAAAEAITIGVGILGTGGGGNPYLGKLHLQRLLRERAAPPTVVAPEEVLDDALIVTAGGMGVPTVTTEVLRYGLCMTVLGIPAPALLRTPAALAVVGPGAFGYAVDYRPLPGTFSIGINDRQAIN